MKENLKKLPERVWWSVDISEWDNFQKFESVVKQKPSEDVKEKLEVFVFQRMVDLLNKKNAFRDGYEEKPVGGDNISSYILKVIGEFEKGYDLWGEQRQEYEDTMRNISDSRWAINEVVWSDEVEKQLLEKFGWKWFIIDKGWHVWDYSLEYADKWSKQYPNRDFFEAVVEIYGQDHMKESLRKNIEYEMGGLIPMGMYNKDAFLSKKKDVKWLLNLCSRVEKALGDNEWKFTGIVVQKLQSELNIPADVNEIIQFTTEWNSIEYIDIAFGLRVWDREAYKTMFQKTALEGEEKERLVDYVFEINKDKDYRTSDFASYISDVEIHKLINKGYAYQNIVDYFCEGIIHMYEVKRSRWVLEKKPWHKERQETYRWLFDRRVYADKNVFPDTYEKMELNDSQQRILAIYKDMPRLFLVSNDFDVLVQGYIQGTDLQEWSLEDHKSAVYNMIVKEALNPYFPYKVHRYADAIAKSGDEAQGMKSYLTDEHRHYYELIEENGFEEYKKVLEKLAEEHKEKIDTVHPKLLNYIKNNAWFYSFLSDEHHSKEDVHQYIFEEVVGNHPATLVRSEDIIEWLDIDRSLYEKVVDISGELLNFLPDKKSFLALVLAGTKSDVHNYVFNEVFEYSELPTSIFHFDCSSFLVGEGSFSSMSLSRENKEKHRLFKKVYSSPSQALQAIARNVVSLAVEEVNADEIVESIMVVYERNNLPDFAKLFKVVQIFLWTPEALEAKIFNQMEWLKTIGTDFDAVWNGNEIKEFYINPKYENLSLRRKYDLAMKKIYEIFLKTYINSNNENLKEYMEFMYDWEWILKEYEEWEADMMEERDLVKLYAWLNKLNVLYSNKDAGIQIGEEIDARMGEFEKKSVSKEEVLELYEIIKNKLKLTKKNGSSRTITKRMELMFLSPAGFSSYEDVLKYMQKIKVDQAEKTVNTFNEGIEWKDGHRVVEVQKGMYIHSCGGQNGKLPRYMWEIFQTWSKPKEFLGDGAKLHGDLTQLDSDTSLIDKLPDIAGTEERNEAVVMDSEAWRWRYGGVLLVLKPAIDPKTKKEKTTFPTPVHDTKYSKHYGFQSIDIKDVEKIMLRDEILQTRNSRGVQEELEKMWIYVVKHWAPINITNIKGEVLFWPVEFSTIQKALKMKVDLEYSYDEKGGIINTVIKDEENREYQEFLENKKAILEKIEAGDTGSLFAILDKIPFFEKHMSGETGVSENETKNKILGEHTKNVMDEFYKNFGNEALPVVDIKLMGSIFLLHDIGKAYAYEKLGNKELQHLITWIMIPDVLNELGFKDWQIQLALSIIDQPQRTVWGVSSDVMTSIIVEKDFSKKSVKEVQHIVKREADKLNIAPKDYFSLLEMFTICDGGVYVHFQKTFEKDENGKRIWNNEIEGRMDLVRLWLS